MHAREQLLWNSRGKYLYGPAPYLPAQPSSQERPHDCFSQSAVSALTLPACLWAVVTWCLPLFRIFFWNAFLIKATLCFSNLPLEAGYTCKALLVILKHIVCKPSGGRRQKVMPSNFTTPQQFKLEDLILPNIYVFCSFSGSVLTSVCKDR